MKIKVTVCELHDELNTFAADWLHLVAHVQRERSQFVILPEMPFYPWFGATPQFDRARWDTAVSAHERWLTRLEELAPAIILSSRPVERNGQRLNEGFGWKSAEGYRPVHTKYYLPDEEGVWEASWYQRGDGHFSIQTYDNVRLGMLLCSELWAMEQIRSYSNANMHLLVVPRITEHLTTEKWIIGGRATAIIAGAFCASSNRVGGEGKFGGHGWVIGPDGDILGLTSQTQPFISVTIDTQTAEQAKTTYPRYIFSPRQAP